MTIVYKTAVSCEPVKCVKYVKINLQYLVERYIQTLLEPSIYYTGFTGLKKLVSKRPLLQLSILECQVTLRISLGTKSLNL
jgi:hypothetical protein